MTSTQFSCRKIDKYDGQNIFQANKIVYELGNYLGGGASGSVYQAVEVATERSVAVKILNPLGYKNTIVGQINKCAVAVKGQPLSAEQMHGKRAMQSENVWWLMHPQTKVLFAAYEDPHRMQLRELPLPRCVEIWGLNPLGIDDHDHNQPRDDAYIDKLNLAIGTLSLTHDGQTVTIPKVSPKYLNFLRSRQSVCREMNNMLQIGGHPNVIDLLEVLELVQDTKTTLFLVLELVNGGELFERMKAGLGNNVYSNKNHSEVHTNSLGRNVESPSVNVGRNTEALARMYFNQLLSGLDYCHKKGTLYFNISCYVGNSLHIVLCLADITSFTAKCGTVISISNHVYCYIFLTCLCCTLSVLIHRCGAPRFKARKSASFGPPGYRNLENRRLRSLGCGVCHRVRHS